MDAGVALVDSSDHLPVFCMLDRQISRYKRAFYFVIIATLMWTSILRDVEAVDWIDVCNESNDIHEKAANCMSILKKIADKHAPVKK